MYLGDATESIAEHKEGHDADGDPRNADQQHNGNNAYNFN